MSLIFLLIQFGMCIHAWDIYEFHNWEGFIYYGGSVFGIGLCVACMEPKPITVMHVGARNHSCGYRHKSLHYDSRQFSDHECGQAIRYVITMVYTPYKPFVISGASFVNPLPSFNMHFTRQKYGFHACRKCVG